MKVPFLCNKCDKEIFDEPDQTEMPCRCGGKMTINYRDNYEQVYEISSCHTCIHNFEGTGEKCNYCNII